MQSTAPNEIKSYVLPNEASNSQPQVTFAEIKVPVGIEIEADLLVGLLNGMLSTIHELALNNPANLTQVEIETLGAQVDILNNYFNHVLYVALQSIRIKTGKTAKKSVELGANDPLYVAMIFLSSGTTPSIETQNKFKSLSTQMLKLMDGFPKLAKEKAVSYELTNKVSQCIVMLTSAVGFIGNNPNRLTQLSEENPSVLLLVKELETLSATRMHDFTSSFTDDPEALAREQKIEKLGYEHKEKALKLFVQFEGKKRKRVELAAEIQKLYEHFVKDLKSNDYDAQGIATILVTKEQLAVFKVQFQDNLENGMLLQIYKSDFILGPPVQYMIHALCEAAKERPFELEVDEKSIMETLKIDQVFKKTIFDPQINGTLEKVMVALLKDTLTILYVLYVEKFSHKPNTPARKEFCKLLIHHASTIFPQRPIVTFKEETHKIFYDSSANDKTLCEIYEGDYSDFTFKITSVAIRHTNKFSDYFSDSIASKSKFEELLNLGEDKKPMPSQVEKIHLVGDHRCSLLTDSQKTHIRNKLDQYPDNRYSKKILGEDFPYGIIKNNGKYFVIYEGHQKNKLLGTGSTSKVKLAQSMDDDKWFSLKVFVDEALASKELQKLVKLNKTPQKKLFAKKGKSSGKIPGQMKYNILIQYAHGDDLQNYVDKNRHQLTVIDLIDIALGMIHALQKLHQTHFHCDIKLKNFVISDKKNIALIDFGSAVERGIINKLTGFSVRGEIAGTDGHMHYSIIEDLKRGATHTYYSEASELFALSSALEKLFFPFFLSILIEMKFGKTTYSKGAIGTSTVIPPFTRTDYLSLNDVERHFKFIKFKMVIKLGKEVSLSTMEYVNTFQHTDLTHLSSKIEKLKQSRNEKQIIATKIGWPSCEPLIPDIIELDNKINILQLMHDNLLTSLKSSVLKQSGDEKFKQGDYQVAKLASAIRSPVTAHGDAHEQLFKAISFLLKKHEKRFAPFLYELRNKNYSKALRRISTATSELELVFSVTHTFLKKSKELNITFNINETVGTEGYSALHYAAQKHNKELYDLLVSFGADINLKDAAGNVPSLAHSKTNK